MPSSRACSSVATEVATQRMPLRPRAAIAGSRWATVEPVPSPTVIPSSTSSAAASAAMRFSASAHRRALYPRRVNVFRSRPQRHVDLCSREMDARIWLTGEGGEPRSVALAAERTVVGRDPEADIHIDDEAVSWNHLEIESRGGVLMATDLDSRNGTALNGEPLDRPRRLRDGDTLIVGGHRLEVSDPVPGRAGGDRGRQRRPSVALTEEERATAAALVAPYRSEGAFAGRPATRAEIAEALHVSERTAQRRLDALAAKLDVPGDAGRERPRLIAARVIELGLDRPAEHAASVTGHMPETQVAWPGRAKAARSGRGVVGAHGLASRASVVQMQPPEKGSPMLNRSIKFLLTVLALALLPVSERRRRRHSGAVVFSRAIATVEETESGKVEKAEGGLFAAKDGHLNQLTEDPTDTEPDFSADGRKIAFVRGGDVWSMRADGTGQHKLTSGPEVDSRPQFDRRATTSSSSAAPRPKAARATSTGSTSAAAPARSSPAPDDEHEASFSPDGKTIVFVRSIAETGGGFADDVYSVRPSGAGLARLSKTGHIDEFSPRYFKGGIVFSRGQSGEGPGAYADIFTMRRNGTKVKVLVAGAGSSFVEDVAPAARMLLFRRDQGLWVKKIGPGRAHKLSEVADNSATNSVFSSDGRKVAAFIATDEAETLSAIDVASRRSSQLAEGFRWKAARPRRRSVR